MSPVGSIIGFETYFVEKVCCSMNIACRYFFSTDSNIAYCYMYYIWLETFLTIKKVFSSVNIYYNIITDSNIAYC